MEREDKEILLRDLSARLPYGVKCQHFDDKTPYVLLGIDEDVLHIDCPVYDEGDGYVEIEYCKPYLRPMSSMTEEEKKELRLLKDSFDFNCYTAGHYNFQVNLAVADWLLKNHFDYRGLIPMGLAIEVTEENNPYEK